VLTPVRRVPRRTLFPYTTLFRSSEDIPVRLATYWTPIGAGAGAPKTLESREILPLGVEPGGRVKVRFLVRAPWSPGEWQLHVRLDRKSTRLNSSHLGISYAVFCL